MISILTQPRPAVQEPFAPQSRKNLDRHTSASHEPKVRLRDKPEPGYLWVDNEIYDVFGDELGNKGLSVYTALARLSYGTTVKASLRELADIARMSKDSVSRAMQTMVRLGLVIEQKSHRSRVPSTYKLTNAKELAREYVGRSVVLPVSGRDSKQYAEEQAVQNISESLSPSETQLSQKRPNLSHQKDAFNKTQDTRLELHPPTPLRGEGLDEDPDEDLEGEFDANVLADLRESWEMRKRVDARASLTPPSWEAWLNDAPSCMRHAAKPPSGGQPENEFAQCSNVDSAAALIAQQFGDSSKRARKCVAAAIDSEIKRSGESLARVGERACLSYRRHVEMVELRYRKPIWRFFSEGHWLNQKCSSSQVPSPSIGMYDPTRHSLAS